jgi:hypothetical protein
VRGRHLTTAVTLLVLLAILAAGALWGARALFAPLPTADPSAHTSTKCATRAVKKGQKVTAAQVQVSVFNAGTRSGLADETMVSLTKRGFKEGTVGNAPETSTVKRAQVWTTVANDTAARLVARQFGRATTVRRVRVDLGPGVDVVIGNQLGKLAKAKRSIVATRASSVCVPAKGGS